MTQQHKHLIVRADIGWCPQEEDLNKISELSSFKNLKNKENKITTLKKEIEDLYNKILKG